MKLTYEELCDKIFDALRENPSMVGWQKQVDDIIQESGWGVEEWENEVFKRADEYEDTTR